MFAFCETLFLAFDLFNFFYFPLFGDGNSSASGDGTRRAIRFRACAFDSHSRQRTQSEELAAVESRAKKDIKLKVVKTSSRFSIYFQLHFALLQGALRKCVFVCFQPLSRKKIIGHERGKVGVCKCGLLPPARGQRGVEAREKREKPNKIIYCLSICEISFDYNSHISIISIQSRRRAMSTLVRTTAKFFIGFRLLRHPTSFSCRKM